MRPDETDDDGSQSLLGTVKTWLGLGASEAAEEHQYGEFTIESTSPGLVVVPDSGDITDTDIRYPLIKPFADAHIYWDDDEEALIYDVHEPTLTDREQQIFDDLRHALEEKIDVPLSKLDTTEKIVGYLEQQIDSTATELGYMLTEEEKNKIMYYVYRNFAGLNAIEALMHDPFIEDIGCSGLDIPVYIVHTKFGSIQTNIAFHDEDRLKRLVIKLAERADKYVSYAEPLLDGTLPDGSRVNASLTQDVTTKGPTFSIRKFQEVPYSAIDIMDLGTANSDIMAYMWMALEYQNSMLVIGGTATGKTTFLNSIVTFIPPEQKIVSIEDTRELQLPHENWIPSVTRSGIGRDSAEQEISMYQLLRESFRQNPDYVVVGEVRGEEASVLFQGMASGHPSLSTMHASSPGDVISRLTTPPINLSPSLVETLDLIVSVTHASEYGKNARRVDTVYEVERISDEGSLRTNQYFSWTPVDDTYSTKNQSTLLDRIGQQFGFSKQEIQDELADRKKVLEWMHDKGYTHFSEVARIVSEYYSNKDRVMEAISRDSEEQIENLLEEQQSGRHRRPSRIEESMIELEESIEEQDDQAAAGPEEPDEEPADADEPAAADDTADSGPDTAIDEDEPAAVTAEPEEPEAAGDEPAAEAADEPVDDVADTPAAPEDDEESAEPVEAAPAEPEGLEQPEIEPVDDEPEEADAIDMASVEPGEDEEVGDAAGDTETAVSADIADSAVADEVADEPAVDEDGEPFEADEVADEIEATAEELFDGIDDEEAIDEDPFRSETEQDDKET